MTTFRPRPGAALVPEHEGAATMASLSRLAHAATLSRQGQRSSECEGDPARWWQLDGFARDDHDGDHSLHVLGLDIFEPRVTEDPSGSGHGPR